MQVVTAKARCSMKDMSVIIFVARSDTYLSPPQDGMTYHRNVSSQCRRNGS